MKVCSACKESKSLDSFHRDKGATDGRARLCKPCANRRARKWYKDNPDRARTAREDWARANRELVNQYARERAKADPERSYTSKLRYRYGITADEYHQIFDAQDGLCGICRKPPGKTRLHIDHDHETGKIRMLLCRMCNQGLGYFLESPELMRTAALYIERFKGAQSDSFNINNG